MRVKKKYEKTENKLLSFASKNFFGDENTLKLRYEKKLCLRQKQQMGEAVIVAETDCEGRVQIIETPQKADGNNLCRPVEGR